MDGYTLLYVKWITKQGATVQHRELRSVLSGSLDGKGAWGRLDDVYV